MPIVNIKILGRPPLEPLPSFSDPLDLSAYSVHHPVAEALVGQLSLAMGTLPSIRRHFFDQKKISAILAKPQIIEADRFNTGCFCQSTFTFFPEIIYHFQLKNQGRLKKRLFAAVFLNMFTILQWSKDAFIPLFLFLEMPSICSIAVEANNIRKMVSVRTKTSRPWW